MVKDILIDESFDLQIANGDFVVGPSDTNHIALILNTFLGGFREFPLVGVGIKQYIGSSGQESVIKRAINVQLQADGYRILKNEISQNGSQYTYDIEAERTQ